MPLAAGTKLGPYEIVGPLGAGGMGEVYRAKDTRLDRTVAIKILPALLSTDPTRRMRFEREAKTVSALNHPHICSLFDVGSQDGIDYLVMECIEGESLAQRLERGALPTEQVLKIGAEMADALSVAHRSGVVHRDIKPGNIMLTKSGSKLLDFGLARPVASAATLATLTASVPAQSSPVTEEGTLLGTFPYMSPEQVEGKELDARSDIFSLGAVIYEMLAGQRAFAGKSQLSVASAILEKEVTPIGSLKPLTPPALEHAVSRCLAKDPDNRWQTARDLAGELKWIGQSGTVGAAQTSGAVAAPARDTRTLLGWMVAAALAACLIVAAVWWRRPEPASQTMYFAATFRSAARGMAVAPNGHTVAVAAYKEDERVDILWLYEVGGKQAKVLPGSEGASFPFWSPDGTAIGFFSDGKLKRIDVEGGPAQTICDAPNGRGGSWNREGKIIFTPNGEMGVLLQAVSASGGVPEPISMVDPKLEGAGHRWPVFLPDGKHYLFMTFNIRMQFAKSGIYVGELGSGNKKFLLNAEANAAYAEPGYLLFYRDGTLFAQHFDPNRLELFGEPQTILAGVENLPRLGFAAYAASSGQALVAQTGTGASLSRMEWFDRKGTEIGAVGKQDVYANLSLSPDGKMVATDRTDETNQNTDVWVYNLQGDGMKRMTFDPAIDATPVWSPDGKQLVFASGRNQAFDLYLRNADGTQEEKPIEQEAERDKYPTAWSPDGKHILYQHAAEVWSLSFPELKHQLYLKSSASVKNAQFSPDGKWVAYNSNESGRWEVFVTSFPDAKGKWQISTGGGRQPRWRGDGKELFYLTPDAKMMAAPVTSGANFEAGAPVTLFQANPRELVATSEIAVYDVSKDGQRFLINTQVNTDAARPMSVILNWNTGMKAR
jgi:Tol biopolymer transport system component